MLALESDRWATLSHAYGAAHDIPDLLRQLDDAPPGEDWQAEPYFTLWSALYHQDDIYDASYAAVPHLVAQCQVAPMKTQWTVAHLATRIELARQRRWGPEIPNDLQAAYRDAIQRLPHACLDMLSAQNEKNLISISAAAVALLHGEVDLAEAYEELQREQAKDAIEWLKSR